MRRVLALVVAIAWAGPAFAQNGAQLSGQVRDPAQAVVAGASLTVIHLDSGLRRTAITSGDGWYAVSSLPAGEYKITARKSGFRTVARLGVELAGGDAARLDFDLEIGGMHEFITVEGGAATINVDDATAGIRIDEQAARRLPVNGRTLQGLIALAPGVIATPATLGEAGQFSVNGQRPNANYFVTDGVSSNSGVGAAGLPGQFSGGTLPAMTALGSLQGLAVAGEVREVQVKTSTFAPEFGRMPGAQIQVTTSSGSNSLHGELSHAFRHERLAAADYFANRAGLERAPLRLNDFHAGVGGPVERDKTFFFGAIEVLRLRQPLTWRSAAATALARNAADATGRNLLDAFPRSQRDLSRLFGEATSQTSWPGSVTAGSLRIDRSLGAMGALFVRYHDAPSKNRVGLAQQNASRFGTRSVTVGITHSPAPAMVNDIRFNFTRTPVRSGWTPGLATAETLAAVESLLPDPFQPQPARLYGLAVAGLGHVVWSGESASRQGQFQVVDTLAIAAGRHQFRLGFDYLRLTPSRDGALAIAAARYASLDDLVAARPPATVYGAAPGGSSLIEIASAFAQDTWSASQRLNVTYGARWEYMPPPASRVQPPAFVSVSERPPESAPAPPLVTAVFPEFTSAPEWSSRFGRIAPRAGLAYRLHRDGKWVLRAGAGLFYDLGFASAIDPLNSVPFNSWLRLSTDFSPAGAGGGQYGFADGLRLPHAWQWNVTLEGAAPGGGVASAAWTGSRGRGLLRREGYLAPASPFVEPGPLSPALVLATSNGASSYQAFQAHYRRTMAAGLGGIVSYTWSHSIDNGSWDSGSYLAGAHSDRASSNFDVRHALSAGFHYDLPRFARGWSIHGIARARTGFPIDLLMAESVFGFGFDNAPRPDLIAGAPLWIADRAVPGGRRLNPAAFAAPAPGQTGNLGRNAIRGFGLAQLDAAVERQFTLPGESALRVRLQAHNVTNTAAIADPVRSLASPLFGQPLSMTSQMLGTGRPISGLAPAFQQGGPRTVELSVSWTF